MNITIAIDGPAGSGKGTLAKELAKKYNLINIDTGATYRCVALKTIRENIDINETDKIIEISKNIQIELKEDGTVLMDGEEVTKEIRSKEVTTIVSPISSIVEVRKNMVEIQRKIAANNNVVMEGRDITTIVLPNAKYKFYLDAELESRAKRRYKENLEKGIDMTYEEIYENIKKRDYNDMNKEVGALKRTDEQVYIDTTNLTIEEEVEIIGKIIEGDKDEKIDR
ncbi:MAG: (d)CMP kinase [Bacilli bacterium]|nr:(d)CMP kinase [Bacilli bacterium]